MNTKELRDVATNETLKHVLKLSDAVDKGILPASTTVDIPEIRLDIRGACAGQSCYCEGKTWVRFNEVLFRDNLDYFKAQTIPHELAHWVIMHNGEVEKNEFYLGHKPHGNLWRKVMRILGAEPRVTHDLDVRKATPSRIMYKCECREWPLSKTRHNKILRGRAAYSCPKCKQGLEKI